MRKKRKNVQEKEVKNNINLKNIKKEDTQNHPNEEVVVMTTVPEISILKEERTREETIVVAMKAEETQEIDINQEINTVEEMKDDMMKEDVQVLQKKED